jgi:hypothetical protein
MKTIVLTVLLALSAMTAMAADVSGKWSGTFTPDGESASHGVLILKQTGDTISGTGGPDDGEQMPIKNGKIDGDRVTFEIQHPSGMTLKMSLVLSGDSMKGDVTASGGEGQSMKAKLEVTRVKA